MMMKKLTASILTLALAFGTGLPAAWADTADVTPVDPTAGPGSTVGPEAGGFKATSDTLHGKVLPLILTGIEKKPELMGVPDEVRTIVPVPTANVPAGVVRVIPFTVGLV